MLVMKEHEQAVVSFHWDFRGELQAEVVTGLGQDSSTSSCFTEQDGFADSPRWY